MSLVVIYELGGRCMSMREVTVNIPHVVGKSDELMVELMEGFRNAGEGLIGNE